MTERGRGKHTKGKRRVILSLCAHIGVTVKSFYKNFLENSPNTRENIT